MHSVLETLTAITVLVLLIGPVVGFVWVMRYIKKKERAALIEHGILSEEKTT